MNESKNKKTAKAVIILRGVRDQSVSDLESCLGCKIRDVVKRGFYTDVVSDEFSLETAALIVSQQRATMLSVDIESFPVSTMSGNLVNPNFPNIYVVGLGVTTEGSSHVLSGPLTTSIDGTSFKFVFLARQEGVNDDIRI